jgi:hypothetical protein
MDYSSQVEYCGFSTSGPLDENDPCNNYEYTDISAQLPYKNGQSTSVYFSISSDNIPGSEGRYCSASVSYNTGSGYTGDVVDEFGESHSFSLNVAVTDSEYADCQTVLETIKGQLPATCEIYEG